MNRVISQDSGDRTSMTLEQSESIPANKNKTETRVYLLFLQYHWRCWIYKTVHVVIRKGAIREITHNGVGTINPLFEALLCLLFCTPKSREIACFLVENGRPLSVIFFKRGVTLQSSGTS